jgi:flagellar motility protein MotE (MotC chaperone)
MVRMIGMLLFGCAVFAAAAGGTWFWKSKQHPSGGDAHGGETAAADSHAASPSAAPAVAHAGDHHGSGHDAAGAEAGSPEGMPVAVRPRPMSIEELLRMGMGLNEREEALTQREAGLERQETQLKLALADLRGEQDEIVALRAEVQQQLQAADGYLAKIQQARDDLSRDRAQQEEQVKAFESSRIEIDSQQRENIKQLSTWIQSMEPDKASAVLREMANDGRMETAVKLLSQLEEREVAKILSALDDAKLVDQFITRFQDLKRPERTASRR